MTTGLFLPRDPGLLGRHAGLDGRAMTLEAAHRLPQQTGRGRLVLPAGGDRPPPFDGARRSSPGRPVHPDAGRFLTTVVITDIVGSTAALARLGDRRWRDLLAEHFADCRAEVEGAAGEIVATAGEGVIAIFGSPTRAVRAGMRIEAAARYRGIAARAGVHTGECERMGDGIVGLSVHIAARVCALAGADEVMTTSVVRELTLGSLLEFEFCGARALKGVPGDWPVFRATDAQQQ
jgi:class 3 adenylate cyclase